MPFTFGEEPVFAGQSVQIACFVNEGDLPLEIRWELNGNYFFEDLGIVTSSVGKKSSLLSIDAISSAHSGEYSCIAENRAGRTRLSSLLNVNGNFC